MCDGVGVMSVTNVVRSEWESGLCWQSARRCVVVMMCCHDGVVQHVSRRGTCGDDVCVWEVKIVDVCVCGDEVARLIECISVAPCCGYVVSIIITFCVIILLVYNFRG